MVSASKINICCAELPKHAYYTVTDVRSIDWPYEYTVVVKLLDI